MRAADAPSAGWYPDPENRSRLRWWDGLDWTEARRAPPSEAELEHAAESGGAPGTEGDYLQSLRAEAGRRVGRAGAADHQEIVEEVRRVARSEVDRAADVFSHRTRQAIGQVTPLIDTYTTRFTRAIKFAAILALVFAIAWFTFQTIAEASFLEWIGDRIDNIFDDENGAGLLGGHGTQ